MEQIEQLNQLLAVYQKKQGREAQQLYELYAVGLLRGLPRDPSGKPYVIGLGGRARLGPNSRVNLQFLR